MTNDEILTIPRLEEKIPGITSRESVLDMMRALRKEISDCSPVTPAFIRDTTFHLERSLFKKEITEREHSLLFNDLISLSAEFSDKCICKKR